MLHITVKNENVGIVNATPSRTVAVITVPKGLVGQQGAEGAVGPQGDPGEGVPVGGTTGQALVKSSNTNYDTEWDTLIEFESGVNGESTRLVDGTQICRVFGPVSGVVDSRWEWQFPQAFAVGTKPTVFAQVDSLEPAEIQDPDNPEGALIPNPNAGEPTDDFTTQLGIFQLSNTSAKIGMSDDEIINAVAIGRWA